MVFEHFPSVADFAGDGSFTSEDGSAADMTAGSRDALAMPRQDFNVVDAGHNSEENSWQRMMNGTVHVAVRHTLRKTASRAASAEPVQTVARAASTSLLPRAGSEDSWWRAIDLPANRKHVHRLSRSFKMRRPAGSVLTEWPTVDHNVVDLLSFEIDPTALPTDVLCHLAMEMFVSAGLPAGLAEDRVRRFILAIRASMLDNPYHNFYHVFDVMQTTNALATATGTMARLDAWERFALLSAALW
jgi:hypothetical protein